MKEGKHFLNTIWGSLLKVFISAILTQYIAAGKSVFELDGDMWKTFVAAGISAVALTLFNYLNPSDPRYGISKMKTTEIVEKHKEE